MLAEAASANLNPISVGPDGYNGWDSNLSGTTAKVDVVLSNDGNDSFVSDTSGNTKQTYSFAGAGIATGSPVQSVTVHSFVRKSDSHDNGTKIQLMTLRKNGNNFSEAETDFIDLEESSTYNEYSFEWSVNPITKKAWTVSEVNSWTNYYFGIHHTGSGTVRATQIYVTVDYTLPTDTVAPVIVGTPSDITIEATSGAGAVFTYTKPTATDAVDGSVSVSCTPISGSTFALGTNEVTCAAVDKAGNKANTTFKVTIVDKTAPVITLNGDENISLERGTPYTDAGATATDLVDGSVTVNSTGSVNVNVVNTYTITYTATDQAGNTATKTRTISVSDTGAPTINGMPVNMTADATSAEGAIVTYLNPTATDGETSVNVTCTPASGSTFPVGPTTVSCSATDDSGNTETKSFVVTVEDNTKPVISTVSDITTEATSDAGAVVTYTNPTATDAVDGTVDVTCTPASGSPFALGTNKVTCTATDKAGNKEESTFDVIVTSAPVATLQSIAVTTPATKLTFTVGDALDITGLVVTGTYSDESKKIETVTLGDITGFDNTAVVTGQVLTITIGGKTTTYTVDIVAAQGGDDNNNNGGNNDNNEGNNTGNNDTIVKTTYGGAVNPSFLGNRNGLVLGATDTAEVCLATGPYLNSYLGMGKKNATEEVKKLQTFLNTNLGLSIPVTGFFGPATLAAVKEFQLQNADQILTPWMSFGLSDKKPTGYVYKTTKRWINIMQCKSLNIPMPDLSQG